MNKEEITIAMFNDNPYVERGKNPFDKRIFTSIEDAENAISNWKVQYERNSEIEVKRIPFKIVIKHN